MHAENKDQFPPPICVHSRTGRQRSQGFAEEKNKKYHCLSSLFFLCALCLLARYACLRAETHR